MTISALYAGAGARELYPVPSGEAESPKKSAIHNTTAATKAATKGNTDKFQGGYYNDGT